MKRMLFRSLRLVYLGAATIVLCACSASQSGSADTTASNNTISAAGDTALYLHTEDASLFESTFDTTCVSDTSAAFPTAGTAKYTAATTLDDEDSGDIQMDLTLHIGKQSYDVHTNGDVVVYPLDDTYSLIKGSLADTITVSGRKYNLSINTNQLVGSDTLNAGLVLTPEGFYSSEETSNDDAMFLLHFGTPITETEAGEAYLNFLNSGEE